MLTEEQQQYLMEQCAAMVKKMNDHTALLTTAAQIISTQADTIEHLSKDNLALVAKLDELTGRKPVGGVILFQA